jgi:DNA-binding LacI/PurR family transcriptional regulator
VAGLDATSVYIDNYGAAARLARMLVQLGHRNLCLITSTEDEFTSGWQHTLSGGWIDALRETGAIDACTLPVIYHPRGMFYDMMDRILAIRPRITALVLGYPAMVERLAAEPRFHEVQVPGRISVATLNTTRNVSHPPGWPPVTSFEMNMKRVGEVIVAHVQTMLVGVAPPPNVRLPLDIVVTDSIGHPPAD